MKHFPPFLFSLFLLIFISGCSKDNSIEPEQDTDTKKTELQKAILGKWVVATSSSQRTMSENAFLEFLSDSTYIVYNLTETLVQGKFNATSGTNISLENFGTLNEIKFTQNKIDFKLIYSNKTLAISANKTAVASATDKTMMLTHLWSLTSDESGSIVLGNTNNNWNKIITKFTVRFSPSGSYIASIYNNDEIIYAEVANWKWHSTKSDRVVYWSGNDAILEEENYTIIRELTETNLKTLEFSEDENGIEKPFNYTFKRLD